MPILKIPTPLRSYTAGQIEVRVTGGNVGEAMANLVDLYPTLRPHLYDGDGKLRPFVNLFLGGQNVKDLEGLSTVLSDETKILLVPSIAGG
ncbi:MAG TPA: MoaD/ThiS family protein [Anaerolineales bacterium]|nr:MoaD/ThiS family protein [Anaerolineales bacterium]